MEEPPKIARAVPNLPRQELSEELWEPEGKPGWIHQWSRGWRLVLVVVFLVGGYGAWRGKKDYQRFKNWRARALASEALEKARTNPGEAKTLLDQAAILAPWNVEVMRAMADFCEPRHDLTALYALRQIALSGQATIADWERICRISLDWGHPELAPARMLNQWAASPVEELTEGQLLLAARWQAGRGQSREAESRLRQHLGSDLPNPAKAAVEVALCGILLGNLSDPSTRDSRITEVMDRLDRVSHSAETSVAMRTESARLLARLLLSKGNRPLLTGSRVSRLKSSFSQLAADTQPPVRLLHELAEASIDLAVQERPRNEVIQTVVGKADAEDAAGQLVIARWLNDQACFEETIALCGKTAAAGTSSPDWFTVHLDALFARKELETAVSLLKAPGQVLPAITQQLFLYRIDLAMGREGKEIKERLSKLLDAASLATTPDVLRTGENLEQIRQWEPALTLYQKIADDERAGLVARLGIIRCLNGSGASARELIPALQAVLQLWPDLDDARSDLIYLRLLEGTAEEGDFKMAAELTKQSPRYLAHRIPAALALLQQEHPAEALALLQRDPIPWDQVNKGWQAVYGAVLAANRQFDAAREVRNRLDDEALRPGERKLLLRYLPPK